LPGDFIADRPVSSFIQPAGLPIATPHLKVLRRPRESAMSTNAVIDIIAAVVALGALIGLAHWGEPSPKK
jgi:hypothetical protein